MILSPALSLQPSDDEVSRFVKGVDISAPIEEQLFTDIHKNTFELLRFHEGNVGVVKLDRGYLSAGYGHKIKDEDGYSLHDAIAGGDAERWLSEDFDTAVVDAKKIFTGFESLNVDRQAALIDLTLNFGYRNLVKEFPKFINSVNTKNWEKAGTDLQYINVDDPNNYYYMEESDYYKDGGIRSPHIVDLITGDKTTQEVLDEYK